MDEDANVGVVRHTHALDERTASQRSSESGASHIIALRRSTQDKLDHPQSATHVITIEFRVRSGDDQRPISYGKHAAIDAFVEERDNTRRVIDGQFFDDVDHGFVFLHREPKTHIDAQLHERSAPRTEGQT